MDIDGERTSIVKKGIKTRWVFNYVLVILCVLLFLEAGFIFLDKRYLYDQVSKMMTTRAEFISNYYNKYLNQEPDNIILMSDYIVKDFTLEDKIQLSIFSIDGEVIQSTGEYIRKTIEKEEDFLKAQNGEMGIITTETELDEKIISVCYPLKYKDEVVGILNLTTVVDAVEKKLVEHIKISLILITIVILIALFSSWVFSRTILDPIKDLNVVSKKIAKGDYKFRIEKRYDDEIGELAESMNIMANEIEKSQKVKNDFISSISHELRTPLTSIKGWSETILLGPIQNNEIKRSIQIIKNESERLSKLVDELLDFSKIQSGRFNIVLEKMYVEDILIEVVDMMMYRAQEKNLEIQYESNLSTDTIMGDADRLRQVFINIIENAIKFTDSNVPIRVIADEEADSIRISVQDEGIGIESKYLEKIRNNFFKVHHNRQGSGLGLAISDQIIQLHHGKIKINSIEGEGTIVSIRLPKLKEIK